MLTIDDVIIIIAMGFCTGLGIESSKWFFEKIRKNGELLKRSLPRG
ncbi:hypothetical protein MUP59_07665 [Candidatus Bathyarchaeota archaeon]|nr:hypothetical protein [Candidatus Bathyarchaeota archaeon]